MVTVAAHRNDFVGELQLSTAAKVHMSGTYFTEWWCKLHACSTRTCSGTLLGKCRLQKEVCRTSLGRYDPRNALQARLAA